VSKPSETDKRYERYTDWIKSPQPGSPESAEQVERGSRVLHWEGMENGPDPLRAWDAIRWNVADARNRRAAEQVPARRRGRSR
jgi:hypothetical protein